MYRKNDERIFAVFSVLANLAVVAAFMLILLYHFYDGRSNIRDFAIMGLVLSVFFKYQILILKVFILEIRVSNLMNLGRRPGKMMVGMGNIAILLYSVVFWLAVVGCMLAFMPANWRPTLAMLNR